MSPSEKQPFSIKTIRPIWFLIMGIVTTAASHMTLSIDIIGWVATAPFLIFLSVTKGWKSRVAFVLTLIVAWSFVVLKIITPPIPYLMIFLFSVPISLFHLPAYLIWDKFKTRKWSILLFPAILTIMEWIQYTFTPFASWGVAAYTQMHSLPLMQSVSLFGMAGLSFLIYWINVSIAKIVVDKRTSLLSFQLPSMVLLALILFGALRYGISKSNGTDSMTVAAVGTNSEVSGLPLPSTDENEKVVDDLFRKTRIAAKGGAELIVWNEASFFTLQEDEPRWTSAIKDLAKELNITIVASYVLPVSQAPLKYENKYLFVNQEGKVEFSYLKHQPVPGEPAIQGHTPLQTANVSGATIGATICYDYDFPYLAKELGSLKADIVAVPSSDWRGIDPIHTNMAAFRAIEQGHSIVRSTRFGLSAAITPYGEMVSQMSSFDDNNRVMIANLSSQRVTTVYSLIGDVFIYLCFIFVGVFFAGIVRMRRKEAAQ